MIDQLRNLEARTILGTWTADEQFELAKSLAANCGYQLVEAEQDERTQTINRLIDRLKQSFDLVVMSDDNRALLIEGLEGLLK